MEIKLNGGFMCRCSDAARAEADEVLARAKAIVDSDDDAEFMQRAIVWLALEGDFTFLWDQWGAISVKPFEFKGEEPPEQVRVRERFYCDCDDPRDGLAAAIAFYFGEEGEG